MKNKNKLSFIKRFGWLILIGLVLLIGLYSYFVEPKLLGVKSFVYGGEQVPDEFIGKKIVFLSDLHFGVGNLDYGKIVEKVNDEKPDIIILGGDYIDRDPKFIDECVSYLEKLKAPFGVYAVFGNHDNRRKVLPGLKAALSKTDIKIINNESFWINAGSSRIRIGGVGDLDTDDQLIKKTTAGVSREELIILASHNPDYFESLVGNEVDLVFSGHVHGGQMNFFRLWYPISVTAYGKKFMNSLVEEKGISIFTSNGIGMTALPLRFSARPDIISVTLEK
ncbi:MAG: metallophosphoesterase [Patescibacteria group bacterium]